MTENNGIHPLDLEQLLGDPSDPSGPFSYRAIIEADANRHLLHQAEAALHGWGFNTEFVPQHLGGRWRSTEDLVRRLLPVFRRDIALGLGTGVTSLMASVNVWAGGSSSSQQKMAQHLLGGNLVAVGFHELSHGNDLTNNACSAVPLHGSLTGWRIQGQKEVINNIARASKVLLFVRTGNDRSARDFSLFMWDKCNLPEDSSIEYTRLLTSGVRGCQIGMVKLEELILPHDAIVGEVGDAVPTALRAFQVTRAVLPALATGAVDAAIGLAVEYMKKRNLYGESIWELPHARYLLTRAWASLMIADAMARAAVRALHLVPDESFFLSAATKYLVPKLLNDAMHDLTTLFGSSFYAVTDEYGIVEKWLRDLIVLPIGHAGSTSCLLTLIPNLPSWSRRQRRVAPYNSGLFSTTTLLDELDFAALRLSSSRIDSITAPLRSQAVMERLSVAGSDIPNLVAPWRKELEDLQMEASALPPRLLGVDAPPASFSIAKRVCAVLAAGATLGTWYAGLDVTTSPFSTSDSAIEVVLVRLSELLHEEIPKDNPRPSDFPWQQARLDQTAELIATQVAAGFSLGTEQVALARSYKKD